MVSIYRLTRFPLTLPKWGEATPSGITTTWRISTSRVQVASGLSRGGAGGAYWRARHRRCGRATPDVCPRRLYVTTGFHTVDEPGSAFANVAAVTGYTPGQDEIRMRLQLG
jgi:hypothetical protein